MKHRVLTTVFDLVVIAAGAAFLAVSVTSFLQPHNVVSGGVTGISMMIHHLFPAVPISLSVLLLNIPLFLMSWRVSGHKFLLYTIYGTVMSSVFLSLSTAFVPITHVEPLLAAIFGGLLMGVGLGIVFSRGATTGGSDIAAQLLRHLIPHMSMGQLILAIDVVVLSLSGLVFGGLRYILYAGVALFVSSKTIDTILYGTATARVVYVISPQTEAIRKAISERLRRGITLLEGHGGHTGAPQTVILCVVKRQQIASLKKLLREIDPHAFVIQTEASEVLGQGFADWE